MWRDHNKKRADPKRWLSLPSVKGYPSMSRPCSDLDTSLPMLIKQTYLLEGLSAVPCGLVTEKVHMRRDLDSSTLPVACILFFRPYLFFISLRSHCALSQSAWGTWHRLSSWYLAERHILSAGFSVTVTALGFEIIKNLKVLSFCLCGIHYEGRMSDLTSVTFKEPKHIVVLMTAIDFPPFLCFNFWTSRAFCGFWPHNLNLTHLIQNQLNSSAADSFRLREVLPSFQTIWEDLSFPCTEKLKFLQCSTSVKGYWTVVRKDDVYHL